MGQVEMENWKTTGKLNLETMKSDDWMKWVGSPRDLTFSPQGKLKICRLGENKKKSILFPATSC